MRTPHFIHLTLSVCLVGSLFACSSDDKKKAAANDAGVDAGKPAPTMDVLYVLRTDFAPGREFDSYQLETGKPGEILRTNDCATEQSLVTRVKLDASGNPTDGSARPDFGKGVLLDRRPPSELPLESRILLCKDGQFVGALFKSIVLDGTDAGPPGASVVVSFGDGSAGESRTKDVDVVFSIPRDRSLSCDGPKRPDCVAVECKPLPVLHVPHDERCDEGEICDLNAGCVSP